MVAIKTFFYLALHSSYSLFYIICNFWSYVLLFYIIFISKACLWLYLLPLPSGCLQPGYSYSLENLFVWETIQADNLAHSLQSWERASSSALGDEQWECSVDSLFSLHPFSNYLIPLALFKAQEMLVKLRKKRELHRVEAGTGFLGRV